MLSFLLATALAFSEANARTAFASACNLVASCTPRDAGTARGHFAANHLRNAALLQGANARIETFTAPTPVGMKYWCECEITAVEGRMIRFHVILRDEVETIGEGIHERFIINNEHFTAKTEGKRKIVR